MLYEINLGARVSGNRKHNVIYNIVLYNNMFVFSPFRHGFKIYSNPTTKLYRCLYSMYRV